MRLSATPEAYRVDPSTKEWNSILQAIATRQRHLHDLKIDDLRLMVSKDLEGRITPAREETRGMSKQDIVEDILYDEFCTEFDHETTLEVSTTHLDAPVLVELRTKRIHEDD